MDMKDDNKDRRINNATGLTNEDQSIENMDTNAKSGAVDRDQPGNSSGEIKSSRSAAGSNQSSSSPDQESGKVGNANVRLQDIRKASSGSNPKRPHSENSSTEDAVSQPKCQKMDTASTEPKVALSHFQESKCANASADKQAEEIEKIEVKALNEDENKKDDDGITLAVRFPSGTTILSKFQPTETLLDIRKFVTNHREAPPYFEIVRYPNEKIPVDQEAHMTLQEFGFKRKEILHVRRVEKKSNFIFTAINGWLHYVW